MLTANQIATLRTAVLAEPTLAAARTTGDDYTIAAWLNAAPAVAYYVWRSTTPSDVVFDNINWTNLTPADAPDGTVLWQNRSLACQGKQFNLQTMLQGQAALSTGRQNIRAGLQDALTGLPSGTGGAILAANWAGVKAAISRTATRAESLLATGVGTTVAPSDLGWEGTIQPSDASYMR